jgi:hypothetical protein
MTKSTSSPSQAEQRKRRAQSGTALSATISRDLICNIGLGVSKRQAAHDWRKLADVPADKFEEARPN